MSDSIKYSVVIPVYNSEKTIGIVIDGVVELFQRLKLSYELILVNDGSNDRSWGILVNKADINKNIVAIDLLHNYGQHNANLCGFKHSSGDYVITMDDDLQNPPEEIERLISKSNQGYDLVMGQFKRKKHSLYRRLGTRLIRSLNRKIFGCPKGLILSNFRLIRRDVIDRICAYKTSYPYIPGLVLMFSKRRVNVLVEHKERCHGRSNYNNLKILKLVSRLLFNYSSYPLRVVAGIGLVISLMSFFLSLYFLTDALFTGVSVPGWTSIVVLLSFFNGVVILIMSMLGEYATRLINQSSSRQSYYVSEIIKND